MLRDWCQPVNEPEPGDIEWPIRSGKWLRPGPIAEARVLGRWPSQGTYGVWSEAAWEAVSVVRHREWDRRKVPQIGLDVARFGDDWTAGHVRWGGASIKHESANKRDTAWSCGFAITLARWAAEQYNLYSEPTALKVTDKDIPIKVDDDGLGGGVTDQLRQAGMLVIPINAGSSPMRPDDYPNKRSELWFGVADQARRGYVDFSKLDRDTLARLRQQLMAPTWKLDNKGRRMVEKKEDIKQRIGRSPDDADGMNLAYYEFPDWFPPKDVQPKGDLLKPNYESNQRRRGMFGLSGR